VGGREATALLDSGATACCLGKGAEDILKHNRREIISLKGEKVTTADGAEHK